jgi:hypothetical protein
MVIPIRGRRTAADAPFILHPPNIRPNLKTREPDALSEGIPYAASLQAATPTDKLPAL